MFACPALAVRASPEFASPHDEALGSSETVDTQVDGEDGDAREQGDDGHVPETSDEPRTSDSRGEESLVPSSDTKRDDFSQTSETVAEFDTDVSWDSQDAVAGEESETSALSGEGADGDDARTESAQVDDEASQPPASLTQIASSPPSAPSAAQEAPRLNDLGLDFGWNAPAGWGARYLRRIDGSGISVGVGFAPLTLWGMKLSFLFRHSSRAESGLFEQVSVAFLTGAERYEASVAEGEMARKAILKKTPGRTLDFAVGYRWRLFSSGYVEAASGWSFNFQGTFLQRTDEPLVELPDTLRDELELVTPGGVTLSLSAGWRF